MTLASRRKRALSVSGRCKSSRQRGPQGRHDRPQAGCRDQQFPANAHSGAMSTEPAQALTHWKAPRAWTLSFRHIVSTCVLDVACMLRLPALMVSHRCHDLSCGRSQLTADEEGSRESQVRRPRPNVAAPTAARLVRLETTHAFEDLLLFSWAVWQCRAQAAAGEHRHGDEGFGCVESVGPFGQCS